ncbi:MAG: sucrase ferredoxin [Nostocoides sp.]
MRCSAASLAREEPLAGSAPVARRWLMVEVPQGWESQPLDTPPLDGIARDVLAAAEKTHGATILLVRRPGRSGARDESRSFRWWAVDTIDRVQVVGSWGRPEDLALAAEALGPMLDAAREPAELALLVCTHGTRDQCCAIDGRPMARALSRIWADATWECSHLGGHRFAPTFAVLPDGVVYGRVPAGQAVRVVRDHLADRVRGDLLRGESAEPAPVQAALAAAHREAGPTGIRDITPARVTARGQGQWEIVLTTPVGEIAYAVTAAVQPPMPLSCGLARPKPSTTYAARRLSPDVQAAVAQ